MSVLQEQAVQMIHRLKSQNPYEIESRPADNEVMKSPQI